MMLRSLGQNPTEEELKELIASVDEGDNGAPGDGQIQLREFLKLYTEGLDSKKSGQAGKEDVFNVYMAMGVRARACACAATLIEMHPMHTLFPATPLLLAPQRGTAAAAAATIDTTSLPADARPRRAPWRVLSAAGRLVGSGRDQHEASPDEHAAGGDRARDRRRRDRQE